MIDCRGISNKGTRKTIRTLYEISVGHAKSRNQFAWGAKFRTPCEIFADHTKNFTHPNQFRTLCET